MVRSVRRALVVSAMACACAERMPPLPPNEVLLPTAWEECFAAKYEGPPDGVPVRFRITQTMPDFRLRALCVTLESRVVATDDSKDLDAAKGLERRLAIATGSRSFVLRALFLAPKFPGYQFDVRSSHAIEIQPGATVSVTARFFEKGDAKTPVNERPNLEWIEGRSDAAGGGGERDGGS